MQYKSGYKYQLHRNYSVVTSIKPPVTIDTKYIWLFSDGGLQIKSGYAWDGASWAIDTKSFMRGSLVHDALYQLFREGHLDPIEFKDSADRLLQSICREDGMFKARAWWVYKGVKRGGWSSTSRRSVKQIRTAP
tara:strand:- start:13922 stop:14323 length:402 start_codon:yes stop_codon:yes gene_type:complete